jgi:hypothetical protein
MKRICLIIVILLTFASSLFAQAKLDSLPLVTKSILNSGVYWGATFKKNLEMKNSQLEAGYLWDVGENTYIVGGLEYENSLSTYGPNVTVFKKIKQRFYGMVGIGASFYETKFNNTGSLTFGVAYIPDFKFLGTIDLVVIPRYNYTGYAGFTDQAESGDRPAIIDNKASEIWLTLIMIGW